MWRFWNVGTGSAVPSKYRNVSSILYQITPSCSVLLDCGEGTTNQLFRAFPPTILQTIKIIIISHSHADHHLGLPLLLTTISKMHGEDCVIGENEKRRKVDDSPLLLFGPRRVRLFLDQVSTFTPSIRNAYTFVETHHALEFTFNPFVETIPRCIRKLREMEDLEIPSCLQRDVSETGVIRFNIDLYNLELSFFPVCICFC